MNDLSTIWQSIRDARDARGWTNERLSNASGVPESSLQKYLSGKTADPRFESVVRLCIALNLSIDQLCGMEDQSGDETLKTALALAEANARTADAQRETAETKLQSRVEEYEQMVAAYEYRIDIAKDRTIWLRRYLMFTLALLTVLILSVIGILVYDVTHLDRGWFQIAAQYFQTGIGAIKEFFV